MGKVPKFFKFAVLEIIVLVIVIIAIISALFYLQIGSLPGNITSSNFLSIFTKGSISTASSIDNYSLTLKNETKIKSVLNSWEFFGKSYKTSDGNMHNIDIILVTLSADKPMNVIKKTTLKNITVEMGEKVEGKTLLLTFYFQKKDLDIPNIPDAIITGNVINRIAELLNADKNTISDRQKMMQIINETNKKLAENKSGFFIEKNK